MGGFQVSAAQRDDLVRDGVVVLRRALPDELLARWRRFADDVEAQAVAAHARGERAPGCCVIEDPVGPRLMRADDVFEADPELVLDLLASPALVAVARDLVGEGCVPLQADLLFKQSHPHPVILWHQGAPHPKDRPYLNVGIYLDDAPAGDGCVRFVPRTHGELQDIEAVAAEHGWDVPDVVEVPAAAGDIVVQDMMVLHGSPPKRSPGVRRTVYVELRPVDAIRASGAQSERWARLREEWMALVVERADAGAWPSSWAAHLPAVADPASVVDRIMAWPEPPIPAVYSPREVVTDDYPVPRDLRD